MNALPQRKRSSLKAQSMWLMFAKIVSFAISALLPFLVVRYLSKDVVGVYRQTFQVVMNAVSILPLGFSMSAFYFLNREKERRDSTIINILLFNCVVGGGFCLALYLYPQILGDVFQSEEMRRLAPKIGLLVWLWIFAAFLEVVAIANQEAEIASIFIIGSQATKTSLMALAVVVYGTVDAFIYAALIQTALQSIALFFYLGSRFPGFLGKFRFQFFLEQLHYAIPFGVASLLATLLLDVHYYFVGHHFSAADYAVYAYGCFQLPLVGILAESTAAILIPRMNELQMADDKRGMIELTVRAMQKLSFFYFPIYVFLIITSTVFVTTLFTRSFTASIPIFVVNITLLPFDIWIVDPMLRSFKEFGRLLLVIRSFVLVLLLAALWYGVQHFTLSGIIGTVVAASLLERFISSCLLCRKLGVRRSDWRLLANIGKTAVISLIAGALMSFVYAAARGTIPALTERLVNAVSVAAKQNLVDFVSGALILAVSFSVFAVVYLIGMAMLGLVDEEEKKVLRIFARPWAVLRGKAGRGPEIAPSLEQ